MKRKATCVLRGVLLATVVAAGASLCFTARNGVEADLYALVDGVGGVAELKTAAKAAAKSAHFLVKAESGDAARARLAALGVAENVSSPASRGALLDALAPYSRGFLSPATRRQLERGEFSLVRDAAVARLFSPIPPVLPPAKDPFLLFTDYVLEMSAPTGEWVVVGAELTPVEAFAALEAVKGADDVRCAGAPFHTAVASERSKREINMLSAISLFCVVLFGWMLTRSLRFIPLLVVALAAAFCVATAAVFAVFPKPHLMTFVFGTTLIGLGVDYVYHAQTAKESIAKPLTFSFLSTAACFLPLFFSGVGVMRQMALFTVSGLATVYVGVLAFEACREGGVRESVEMCRSSSPRPVVAVIWMLALTSLLVAVFCWRDGRKPIDISRFYRPDPYLAEGEMIAAEAMGGAGFVPPADEQRRNVDLVRRLYAAEGKRLCEMTGLPEKVLALPEKVEVFDPKGALETMFDGWCKETDRLMVVALIALCAVLAIIFRGSCLNFIVPVCTAFVATECLLLCLGESSNFFARICFFIFVGLGLDYCIFRWHASRHGSGGVSRAVRYSFMTSVVGFGLLGFTGFAVTRLMGVTLAFGLAVSYFASTLPFTFQPINFSTSQPGKPQRAVRATAWHEQEEQCASRFWVRFMWYSYAWFGKTFQKVIFVIGMPVIYIFAKPARLALAGFYGVLAEYSGRRVSATHWRLFRHLLGFSWSLMDKTDACTLKKNLPEMLVRDDDGWRAFKADVNAGKGAFILCSHVGMIGVLPALPVVLRRGGAEIRIPKVHAFQQMGHDEVFMKVFMRHFDHSALELHAVEDIGVETAVEMQESIRRGELVIMAGDRTSAGSKSVLRRRFLGRDCAWPKGAFKFAELMEAPVFGVTCVSTGWNRYEVHVARLGGERLLSDYVAFLEKETLAHPDQWYQFYDFFAS